MWDQLLKDLLPSKKLKYEDLTPEERITFHQMLESLQKNELSVEKLKAFITNLKYSIEQALIHTDLDKDKDKASRLMARLENVMLLESFLLSPERAKAMLQDALQGFNKK